MVFKNHYLSTNNVIILRHFKFIAMEYGVFVFLTQ